MSGLQSLLKANKVEVIEGRARLGPSMQVEIDSKQGQKQGIQAKKIILATGSIPTKLSIPGTGNKSGIINAESIVDLDYVPKSLVMIGGGIMGVEIALFWLS